MPRFRRAFDRRRAADFRVNGELRAYGHERLHPEETEQMAKAVIPAPLWQQFQETGELDFSYGIATFPAFA